MENKGVAVFGGGCFWCTEAVFKMLKGVISVEPGYAGGTTENPTWEGIHVKETGHAECIKIEFNPKEISYRDLLTVFFGSHDPTTLNRQAYDIGTEYRSVIFYTNDNQKNQTEEFIKELNDSSTDGKSIVTEVAPLDKFYPAEGFHKDFYENNRDMPYCQIIINPKLEKVQKDFAKLLKTN